MSSFQRLLIFPIDIPQAGEIARAAKILGMQVLGASSETNQSDWVDEVLYLPYITSPQFPAALATTIQEYQINVVHTDHPAVWSFLDSWRDQLASINVGFNSSYPYDNLTRLYEPSFLWAEDTLSWDLFGDTSSRIPSLGELHRLAGLHFLYNRIPGESDDTKLAALYKLAVEVPKSADWVEIGSLYGKSAYALGWLAAKVGRHALICVDPWATEKTEHQGQQAELINRQLNRLDTESVFNIFLANTSQLGNIGHIRDTSKDAVSQYRKLPEAIQQRNAGSDTEYQIQGRIGLLHVDGNHHYEAVKLDIDCWTPLMAKGGWIIVDDYRWAFGDGPKVAADEFLNKGLADIAFTMGDTLYIRLTP